MALRAVEGCGPALASPSCPSPDLVLAPRCCLSFSSCADLCVVLLVGLLELQLRARSCLRCLGEPPLRLVLGDALLLGDRQPFLSTTSCLRFFCFSSLHLGASSFASPPS